MNLPPRHRSDARRIIANTPCLQLRELLVEDALRCESEIDRIRLEYAQDPEVIAYRELLLSIAWLRVMVCEILMEEGKT